MSLLEGAWNQVEREQEGSGLHLPSHFAVYRTKRNSQSWDEASSYDGDRPNSRLTSVESPCDSNDQVDDICLDDLDSADLTPAGVSRDGDKGLFCEECLEWFSTPEELKQHEYSHNSGETPFQCNVSGCVKSFTSKFKLKRHILIHSQDKTFTCSVCSRAFRRKDHLKNHEKVHNPGKTIYSCYYESCHRTYNSLSSFKKHQAMHSAEEGQLDCKICKAVLVSQEDLMNHLKSHTGSRAAKGAVDKKFGCNQCDKKFFTRKDLKRHSVVHTGNREFSCPHCSQRFGRKDHMTRHAKKTHHQFYEPTRQRLPSTPSTPLRAEAVKTTRKERSISDPGPFHSPAYSLDDDAEVAAFIGSGPQSGPPTSTLGFHKLAALSPSSVISERETVAGTRDSSGKRETVIFRSLSRTGPCLDSKSVLYGALNPDEDPAPHIYTIPEKVIGPDIVNLEPEVVNNFALKPETAHAASSSVVSSYSSLAVPLPLHQDDVKTEQMYTKSENAPSLPTDGSISQLLSEKSSIDFDSFICEMGGDFFGKRSLSLDRSPGHYCEIKEEPGSRPASPSRLDSAERILEYAREDDLSVYPGSSSAAANSSQDRVVIVKPVFMRTQSLDSMTRTKNPVLPSIHAEGTLVVPEPKQNRYSSQDPFTIEFSDEAQLTELKGSLFLADEDSQGYFQPWQ